MVVVGLTSMQKFRHKFQSAIVSIVSLQDNHRAVIPAIAPKPDIDVRFFLSFLDSVSCLNPTITIYVTTSKY